MTAVSQGFPRAAVNQILDENAPRSPGEPAVPVSAALAGSSPAAAQGAGYPAALPPVTSVRGSRHRLAVGEPCPEQELRVGSSWLSALRHSLYVGQQFCTADLIALQQEKEAALQQCKKLEEEIQTLRVYYSLYKSLSEGMSLKDQLNCTFGTSEGGLQGREDVVTLTYRQIEDLAAQLQQARSEQKDTELKLQKALEASGEANEKVQKLERLVDVLRKKVGAGTIRTVI
ncbi:PREDICTED: mirror-image polydactyly gene 1 protein-like [Phaethon lepturus]|uniref:mirror-image polydactyly gene 1 protein-like n=1 Tax=Phaethon lepturus TaxID=97097 RepID=UPI00053089A0|nr:PREDICTED: mirror-image polydactyly gene 1 protein-like [Phaethon lepturus]